MLDLSIPQRQSKKSILLYLIKGIKSLLFFFVFGYFSFSSQSSWYMLAFPILLGATALIGPFLNYYFTKFHIENENFIINKGWLNRENKSVPLERIQSINISQNIIQRVLGIAALEIETAGSKAKELEIPGLEKTFADELKRFLNESKRNVSNTENSFVEPLKPNHLEDDLEITSVETTSDHRRSENTVILDLGIIDLFKVGITQNHLKSGGLALGVVFGFWFKIKDFAEEYFGSYLEQYTIESTVRRATITLLVAGLIVFILASIVVSLATTFNKFWGFKMTMQDDHLEVTMGLFNRREVKIPLNKVQLLEFHSNPLRKLLNFQTGKIYQAQSENDKTTNIEVPACRPLQIKQLQELLFNETIQEPDAQLHTNPWSHARLRFYFLAPVTAIAAVTVYYFEFKILIIPLILFLSLSLYAAYRYGVNSKLVKDSSFVVIYKGWLFKSIIISPVYKTQAVERWRSIFLKRRKEIHLKIHTAAGSRGLRYLKENQVVQLANALNNQVIVENRKWM